MLNKLDAIVIDSEYDYIGTFINYLKQLLDVIVNAINSLFGSKD